ncbi:hypothetical protein MAE02_35050 [Microvirga aerophila]|uniref:Uncharacterized protein n=1 Tax=Microvirga aerophila TaxID=670291 RepID=A0A512BV27_9HYPH|nr:hypothetical protein MAE02_35050 [Microvirga aerophila]
MGRKQSGEEAAQHPAKRHPHVELGEMLRGRASFGHFTVANHGGKEEADQVKWQHHLPV